MPTASLAKLEFEAGQNVIPFTELTDSGDHIVYTSTESLWSRRKTATTSFEPDVKPNGLATGGLIIPAVSLTNNLVDTAAASSFLSGILTATVSTTDNAAVRGGVGTEFLVTSVTITSAGAIAMIAGTGAAAPVETRGAAGGPPFIPTDSIEIGQVRLTSDTAAPVASSEIFMVDGLHTERFDFPLFDITASTGGITFLSALPLIHTGSLPKEVFAAYSGPIFAEVSLATDFVPPENSHAVSSTQIYNRTLGSTATTLNQGTFTTFFQTGVTDALVALKNQTLWFRFFPDRFKAEHVLSQGLLGIARTFPADSDIGAACTISADEDSLDKAS